LKVSISEKGPWQKVLNIEVPPEELEKAFEVVVEEFRTRAMLPGFRKGRAPRTLLEAQFGHSMEHEVLERVVRQSYERALRETELVPVTFPEIGKIDFQRGKPLSYEAHVEVRPEVTINEYSGLELEPRELAVAEDEVAKALEDLRQRTAEWAPVEREAGDGDAVLVDYVRLNGKGKPIHKSEQRDALVELGAQGLLPEFREHLMGAKAGEHRSFEVSYPADFGNEELRGKAMTFSIQVRGVRERCVRELDDTFAHDVMGMKDLAELRSRVRLNMEGEQRLRATREEEEALVDQLIAKNPVTLPEGMMKEYLDELLRRLKDEKRDWAPEEEERMRAEYRPMAERRMRRELLLDAVARQEAISVSEEEIDRLLRGASEGEMPPPEVERMLRDASQRDRARTHLMERKAFALLREKARVKMAV
jgi:trigger factor